MYTIMMTEISEVTQNITVIVPNAGMAMPNGSAVILTDFPYAYALFD